MPRLIDVGKQAEYDRFWDAFQENGNRTSYDYGFYRAVWNDANFYPKYDIRPVNATSMFQYCAVTDLAGRLRQCGVTLDFSRTTKLYMAFYWNSAITTVPVVDTRSTTSNNDLYYLFGADTNLESVEKLILKDDGSQLFTGTFMSCEKLREIRFEGVIGKSIDFGSCARLSAASVASVIDHLMDLSGSDAQTLTLHPDISLTDDQKATLTARNWVIEN